MSFKFLEMKLFIINVLLFSTINTQPDLQDGQVPEVNNKLDKIEVSEETQNQTDKTIIDLHNEIKEEIDDSDRKNITSNNYLAESVYSLLSVPIEKLLSTPKINSVLHNIGTCIVNGAMEIVSYYFPAPIIPLIASAAGMVIPFEPVVMLRRRMPVTSYRRAFETAFNGFMNTFNTYKIDNYDEDPYMTRRFNRRFMNDVSKENKKDNT